MTTFLPVLAAAFGVSVLLIAWVVWSLIRKGRAPSIPTLWQCLALFLALTCLQLPLCVALALSTGHGLGHSARANAQFPFVCLLSFLLVTVGPTAGLLLLRYRRQLTPGKTHRATIVGAAATLGMLTGVAFCLGALGGWPPLLFAVNHGHTRLARTLLTLGASTSVTDRYALSTPLTAAVWLANPKMVEALLDHGADINARDGRTHTALSAATIRGDTAMVKLLLRRGADPIIINGSGWTAKMLAYRRGEQALIRLLEGLDSTPPEPLDIALREVFERGDHAQVLQLLERMAKRNGWSASQKGAALLRAAQTGQVDALQEALEIGADTAYRNSAGETAITLASARGHRDAVAFLLEHDAPIDMPDGSSDTALLWAVSAGQVSIVSLLLAKGANVNLTGNRDQTALMKATVAGQIEVVKLLLNARALLEERDRSGRTALMLACAERYEGIAHALLDAGANPNVTDNQEMTALTRATVEEHPAIEKLLLVHGARRDVGRGPLGGLLRLGGVDRESQLAAIQLEQEPPSATRDLYTAINRNDTAAAIRIIRSGLNVNVHDSHGSSPLIWTVWCGKPLMVKLLLNHGADPNGTSEFNVTALMEAARRGHVEIAHLLLARGAKVQARSVKGWTALMWASEQGDAEMVKLLLENGADPLARNNQGQTAFEVAKGKGHSRIIELLQQPRR